MQIVDNGNFHELTTHLVTGKTVIIRTHKELAALMKGAWILEKEWFLEALDFDKNGLPDESLYEVDHFPKRMERKRHPLFRGLSFYFYGHFDSKFAVTELMDFAHFQGGKVLRLPKDGCMVIAENVFSDRKDFQFPQNIEGAPYEDLSEESDFGDELNADDSEEEEKKEKAEEKKKLKSLGAKKSKKKKGKKGDEDSGPVAIDLSKAKAVVTSLWLVDSLIYFERQSPEGYRPLEVDPDSDEVSAQKAQEAVGRKKKTKKDVSVRVLSPKKSPMRASLRPSPHASPRGSPGASPTRASPRLSAQKGRGS